jgi:putative aldouronate transport system permease protein
MAKNLILNGNLVDTAKIVPRQANFWDRLARDKQLYILAAPGLLFFLVFKYLPMWGLVIAFQEYSPYKGILGSKWVGLEHFHRFFSNQDFFILLRNTLSISFLNLFFYFPVPIIISLMLNEVFNERFKKITQTIIYFPHFLSWVIIYGLTFVMLNQTDGVINKIIQLIGGQPIPFLSSEKMFWPMLVFQNIWRDSGWGTVIFLAALAGVDPSLYEAARIDGAGRFKQIWHVTLPGIRNVIIVVFILRLGQVLDVGFEQVYLMSNAAVSNVSDIFDTYVYRNGIMNGQFSYSSAVGIFKSVVGTIMVISANRLSKTFGQEGIY